MKLFDVFIFDSFLGFGTLKSFLSTMAAALAIAFSRKNCSPQNYGNIWKKPELLCCKFYRCICCIDNNHTTTMWCNHMTLILKRMRVIWLHHIVVVWLLWSLWAYCIKGGKTRVTKSRFVRVLNLIGLESGANFLDQSYGEVKQNQSNHRLLSTLNWKILYYM